jgi:hypothetical protein
MISVGIVAQGGAKVPDAPTSFTATPSITSVSLSWAAPSNNGGLAVTSYTLKRGATTIYTGSGTSFNDTGLTASTGYSYTVLATNSLGDGPTAAVSTTTLAKITTRIDYVSGSTSYSANWPDTVGPVVLKLVNVSTGIGIPDKLINGYTTNGSGNATVYYVTPQPTTPSRYEVFTLNAGLHNASDTTLASSANFDVTLAVSDPA